FDLDRVHEQEGDHHRQDVDERNEVQLRIRAVAHVVLRHALGAVRHAHGCAPLADAAAWMGTAAAGVSAAADAGPGAPPAGSAVAGASPMAMSGNSSACTMFRPWLTSNTRTRSITCTSVS